MSVSHTRLRVDFFTRALGAASGTSRAALDILFSLSHAAEHVRVFTWGLKSAPTELDGHAYGPFHVEPIALRQVLRAVVARDAPPRSPLTHALLRLRTSRGERAEPSAGPRLEVVNGLGAHRLAERVRSAADARTGVVRALIVHESPRHFGATGALTLPGALAAIRGYDFRIFVSARGQSEWNELAQLPQARSLYIPNCVNELRVEALWARARGDVARALGGALGDEACLRVACVGTLSQRKGQDLVLEALATLSETAGTPELQVDFVGPDHAGFAAVLKQRARSLGVGHQVRFVGPVSAQNAYERIYAADVLLLASRAEAFPLATLEAMALGTCVVAAAVDGVPEQVLDEQTGLLFPRGDAAALARCLRRVAAEPELRAGFGAAGRTRYLSEFTRARHRERWAHAVCDMATASSPPPGI